MLRHLLAVFRRTDLILLLILAASLATNVYFIRWHGAGLFSAGRQRGYNRIGSILPPLAARGIDGQPKALRFDNVPHPTVLYVFSPECNWCALNHPSIARLVSARARGYRFVSLALSDDALAVSDYLRQYPFNGEALLSPAPESTESLGIVGTPETFAIGRDGRILAHWTGAFSGEVKREVEAFFRLELPAPATEGGREE